MSATSRVISSKKSTNIRVWVFIIAVWIFTLEYAIYVVTDDLSDKLIKVCAFVFVILFARYRRKSMTRLEKVLILLFYLLFLFALVPSLLAGDWIGVGQWLKLVFMSMILPILIFCYHLLREREGLLVSTYITVAVIFSIQAAVAFFGVYWGVFDKSNIVEIGRYSNMPEVSFGLWGYGNAIQTPIAGVTVLRSQGWFLEPSLFASFLLLPAFVSAGRFWQYRKKIYLFSAIIIFFALLTTVSLAGYIAVIAGVIFLFLSKPFYHWLRKIALIKYSYPILIFGIFLMGASFLLYLGHSANEVDTNDVTDEQAVIAKMYRRDPDGPSGNLMREGYKLDEYISLIASNPLGIGFSTTASSNEIQSGNALIFWAVSGGVPAIVLITVFFVHIFFAFCHPLLISGNAISRCLAASFIGHAIHNLSYGNWLAPYFLIHLALVVMYAKNCKINHLRHN